jgi:hypothetical protein
VTSVGSYSGLPFQYELALTIKKNEGKRLSYKENICLG